MLTRTHQAVPSLDGLVRLLVQSIRTMLGHQSNDHVWYKVALTADNAMAATIFDDLSQVHLGMRVFDLCVRVYMCVRVCVCVCVCERENKCVCI